jgi:hypothetical protein
VEQESEAELLEYREKVVAELERRAIRLREIEERVAAVEFSIKAAGGGRRTLMGGVARIQVLQAHRAKLKEEAHELHRERDNALADLQKAESRLKEVDLRLDILHRETGEGLAEQEEKEGA